MTHLNNESGQMILRAKSISLLRRIRWLCLLFLFAASIQWTGATALAQVVDARVASVKGTALRHRNQRAFILARGDALNPGDEIDTRGGGRVVIELTDGSVVIVHPKSRIVISDYRAAPSLREMFRIVIGRVRVKIAHYGGKPNPYRVNSPTASILVRGTEFSVTVVSSGDTRVEVYEGLVEVVSLSNPRYRALLTPGRGAIVRPNEDIRFFTPGARSNERGGGNNGDDNDGGSNGDDNNGDDRDDLGAEVEAKVKVNEKKPPGRGSDDGAPRRNDAVANALMSLKWIITPALNVERGDDAALLAATSVRTFLANDYDGYIAGIAGLGWSLPVQRFAAFADSHLDSLDNPAYATEFTSIEGRLWLIPAFNKALGANLQSGSTGFPFSGNLISPFDSSLLTQGDFFIPLERARAVIGGAVAVYGNRSQSLTVNRAFAPALSFILNGANIERYVAVSTETFSVNGSLMAARRFGEEGRTSVGVGVEWASGGGDLRGLTSLATDAGAFATEELKAETRINRLRFQLGMTRELGSGHKLGLVYRHGLAKVDDDDRSRLFNGLPLSLDSTNQDVRSSEVSLRLRGPLTRRLYYGLEGSFLRGGSDEEIHRLGLTDSTSRANVNGASAGFGVGFALRPATVLSADFGFGLSGVRENRRENETGNLVEERRERERFASGRVGLQTDLWRRSFVSVSALAIWQAATTDLNLYPDLFGRRLTSLGLAESNGRLRQNTTSAFSDFGAGWRFNPNLIAEYILLINYDMTRPRHVFLLRYTFKREKRAAR